MWELRGGRRRRMGCVCWEITVHLDLTLVFLPFFPSPPATLAGARDMKAGCPIVEKPEGGGGEAAAGQAGFGAPASLAGGKDGKALAGGPGGRTLFVPFFPGRPFPTGLGLGCQSLSCSGAGKGCPESVAAAVPTFSGTAGGFSFHGFSATAAASPPLSSARGRGCWLAGYHFFLTPGFAFWPARLSFP